MIRNILTQCCNAIFGLRFGILIQVISTIIITLYFHVDIFWIGLCVFIACMLYFAGSKLGLVVLMGTHNPDRKKGKLTTLFFGVWLLAGTVHVIWQLIGIYQIPVQDESWKEWAALYWTYLSVTMHYMLGLLYYFSTSKTYRIQKSLPR